MTKGEYQFLKLEVERNIGTLTINREDKLNALSAEVIEELRLLLEEIANLHLSGLIFTGAGEKAFIAGADIKAMAHMKPEEAGTFASNGQQITLMLEELRCPVIAAVNGFALGGGLEMALACDFIYATENAVFALPEVSLGLIPGFGGTQRLAKIVGRARAKEMIYTGNKVKATQAKELGLALEVYSTKTELMAAAKATIEKIARNSAHAVGIAKYTINNGVDMATADGLKVEQEQFAQIFDSYDMQEGTKAFLEKRTPTFLGK